MKAAEEILRNIGGGVISKSVAIAAMKAYALQAIDEYLKEAQASLGNRTLKQVSEQIKQELT